MASVEQLQTELKRLESAKRTKEASELLAKFVKENETTDPLVTKQGDNPYTTHPSRAGGGCCVIS